MILLALALGCFAATQALPTETPITVDVARPAPCRPGVAAPVRFDRALRGPVTAAPVASGDYLGALAPLPARAIKRGAPLTLRAMAGPIVIEREVRAVQPARAGGRVFVRDADGHVFAAPLVIAQADQ